MRKKVLRNSIFIAYLAIAPLHLVHAESDKPKTTVYANYNDDFRINLSQLFIPVINSIKVLNADTGEETYLRAPDDYEIKVIGKADDMYEISIMKNGQPLEGNFLTDPQNVKKGVNWGAVKTIVNNLDEIRKGLVFEKICDAVPVVPTQDDHSPTPQAGRRGAREESLSGVIPDTYVPPSEGEFHEGCEVLAVQPINEEDSDKLTQCVSSIQTAISSGNRNANGELNREKVFKAMFSKLKPEEQAFAGYIFTAFGESDMWVSKENPEEAMFVMKVLQNRKRMALDQGANEPYNVLDVALDPWQFSTYNANDPNWKNAIDPLKNSDYSGIVEAFRRMTDPELSSWEPADQMDNVSHYRRDYLSDPWPSSSNQRVRVKPSVNGVDLRSDSSTRSGSVGPSGYNYIYTNVDGPKHWIYTESTRGNWR